MRVFLKSAVLGLVVTCMLGSPVFGQKSKTTSDPKTPNFNLLLKFVVIVESYNLKGDGSQGTGFFIGNGLVITNHHVVKDMVKGTVKRVDGAKTSVPMRIKALRYLDPKNDLALLEIDQRNNPSHTVLEDVEAVNGEKSIIKREGLKISDQSTYEVGGSIAVLSNPIGLTGTLSLGIVSGGVRKIRDTELLQIDAAISHGSSGGPVLNYAGEIVGVAVGSFETGQSINFAVPSTTLRKFIDEASKFQFDGVAAAKVEGAWLVHRGAAPVAVSGNDKAELLAKLTDEELAALIMASVAKAIESDGVRVEPRLVVRGCSVQYAAKLIDSDDSALTASVLSTIDLTKIRGFRPTKLKGLEFDVPDGVLISLEENAPDSLTRSLSRKVNLRVTDDGGDFIVLTLSFDELRKRCSGRKSDTSNATLSETQTWIKDRLQGVSVINGSGDDISKMQYLQIRFSGCNLVLGQQEVYGSTVADIDLRALKKVKFAKSKGGAWAVYLDTFRNFSESETPNYGAPSTEMKSNLPLLMPSRDIGERVAKAFGRIMELCSEPEPKSPF